MALMCFWYDGRCGAAGARMRGACRNSRRGMGRLIGESGLASLVRGFSGGRAQIEEICGKPSGARPGERHEHGHLTISNCSPTPSRRWSWCGRWARGSRYDTRFGRPTTSCSGQNMMWWVDVCDHLERAGPSSRSSSASSAAPFSTLTAAHADRQARKPHAARPCHVTCTSQPWDDPDSRRAAHFSRAHFASRAS